MLKDKIEAWVPVDGYPGFEVKLAYLSRPEIDKIRKSVTKPTLNRKTRAMEDTVDTDMFSKILVKESILDWKGFTLEHALSLLPIELPKGADVTSTIEFTTEDAVDLVQNSPVFDSWLNEVIFSLDSFRSGK